MWFKKKVETKIELKIHSCDHKWKDFGITLTQVYQVDTGTYLLKVYKHYACIWCKERKRVELVSDWCRTLEDAKKKEEEIGRLHKVEYDSVVMERIFDFQLIDREYLEVARRIYPDRGI